MLHPCRADYMHKKKTPLECRRHCIFRNAITHSATPQIPNLNQLIIRLMPACFQQIIDKTAYMFKIFYIFSLFCHNNKICFFSDLAGINLNPKNTHITNKSYFLRHHNIHLPQKTKKILINYPPQAAGNTIRK